MKQRTVGAACIGGAVSLLADSFLIMVTAIVLMILGINCYAPEDTTNSQAEGDTSL